MRTLGARGKRAMILFSLLAVSFGLYAAAELGVSSVEMALLGVLVIIMLVAVKEA
jgi:hypothetical protein